MAENKDSKTIETTTATEETQTKKKLTEKQEFWLRMGLYILFGLALPCAFIIWRCDLFSGSASTLGFWGVILVLIVSLFCNSCLKWLRKGMKFSLAKQIVDGVIKIIVPLVTILLFIVVIKNNVDLVIQSLSCIIACELIAIPINPLPEWHYKNKGEEYEGLMDTAINKYFTRKKEEEKK